MVHAPWPNLVRHGCTLAPSSAEFGRDSPNRFPKKCWALSASGRRNATCVTELKAQTALGVGPVVFGGGERNAECVGDLRHGQAGEKAQAHHRRRARIGL